MKIGEKKPCWLKLFGGFVFHSVGDGLAVLLKNGRVPHIFHQHGVVSKNAMFYMNNYFPLRVAQLTDIGGGICKPMVLMKFNSM